MSIYKKYKLLSDFIYKNGKKFEKKHGNWIKLPLFKDYYLSMDSWNGAIKFNRGIGRYEYWLGFGFNEETKKFEDKEICHLGLDFGGFATPDREETLDFINLQVLGLKYYQENEKS